jgi:hypothetical protein
MGIVRWMQVRSAAPDGPKNIWSRFDPGNVIAAVPSDTTDADRTGEPGRGILYPFTKPLPGQWHSAWHAYKLEPTKEVVRKVLQHHKNDPTKKLKFITTEMINLPDYAHNAKFSLIGQNSAIAQFVRDSWAEIDSSAA